MNMLYWLLIVICINHLQILVSIACFSPFQIGLPLTVVGGIVGKNTSTDFDAPCRTKNIAREIPQQPWYRHTLCHVVFGGFLPFRYRFYFHYFQFLF